MADPLRYGNDWGSIQYGANDPGVPSTLPQGIQRSAGGTYYGAGAPTPQGGVPPASPLNWSNLYATGASSGPAAGSTRTVGGGFPMPTSGGGGYSRGGGGGGGTPMQLTGISPQAYAALPYAPPAQDRTIYNRMRDVMLDPASVANHPAYKFLQQEQERALGRSAAGRRMRFHGDTMDAFAARAADRAHMYTGDYTNRLLGGAGEEFRRTNEDRSRYDTGYQTQMSALNRLADMTTFASMPGASGANVDYVRNLQRMGGTDPFSQVVGARPLTPQQQWQQRQMESFGYDPNAARPQYAPRSYSGF